MTWLLVDLANRPIRRIILSSTPPAFVGIKMGSTTTAIGIKVGSGTTTTTSTGGIPFVDEVGTNIREINRRLMLCEIEVMTEHVVKIF